MNAKRALQLFVLAAMALSLPLLGVLKNHPEFLAAHQLDRFDMIVLTLFGALVLPLLCVVPYLATRLINRRLGAGVFHLLFWLLLIVLLMPLLGQWFSSAVWVLLLAATAAGLLLWWYHRSKPLQTFVSLYALALPVLVALFVLSPAVRPWFTSAWSQVETERINNKSLPPMVFIVLDEFPLTSLISSDASGRPVINADRFPSLARLARRATWFPDHTVNADNTAISVPALLNGRIPTGDDALPPTWRHHPVNLFTALAPYYAMDVHQNGTDLCPNSLCRPTSLLASRRYRLGLTVDDLWIIGLHRLLPDDLVGWLPSVDNRWLAFRDRQHDDDSFREEEYIYADRGRVFRRFIAGIGTETGQPGLHYLHSMLPHAPFSHLADGTYYTLPESSQFIGNLPDEDQSSFMDRLYDDPQAALLSRQQHLLQAGFADRLIGEMIDRLEATGLYDQALVIVTSDHGASFSPGQPRRELTDNNLAEIAGVPLLIKYPGQVNAEVSGQASQSIDLLPTVLSLTGIRIGDALDGNSLQEPSSANPRPVTVVTETGDQLSATLDEYRDAQADAVSRLDLISGQGTLASLTEANLLPASAGLVGTSLSDLPVSTAADATAGVRVRVAQLKGLRQWAPQADYRLSMFYAELENAAEASRIFTGTNAGGFAVSINDTIACLSRFYRIPGLEHQFRCLYDNALLTSGENRITVTPIVQSDSGEWRRLPDMALIHADAVTGTKPGNPARIWRNVRAQVRVGDSIRAIDPAMSSLFGAGWSAPQTDHRWSESGSATLTFRSERPIPAREYELVLHGRAFLHPPALMSQRVRLLINGSPVADTLMRTPEMAAHRFRFSLASPASQLDIRLEFPDASRPVELGFNPDTRLLGIALTHWQLEPVTAEHTTRD